MFETPYSDIQRFTRAHRPLTVLGVLLTIKDNYGLQALLVFRFGKKLMKLRSSVLAWPLLLPLFPIYWALAAIIRVFYDIELRLSADIGPGFYIGHFGGIVVENCLIASGCAVNQQVQIRPEISGDIGPVVGNNVWVGAHAKIFGSVNIGDGATIGAGAVVTKDVPAQCLVLGNPAKITLKNYDNSQFR